MARRQVAHDVLARPAAARHHHRARSDLEETSALHVGDHHVRRARRIARVLDAHDCGVETNARRLPRAIERGEVNAIAPYRVDGARAGERVGDERLHHQARESAVPVGEHLVAERRRRRRPGNWVSIA